MYGHMNGNNLQIKSALAMSIYVLAKQLLLKSPLNLKQLLPHFLHQSV